MKVKNIVYWITTGLISAMTAMGAFMSLSGNPEAVAGTVHLGYPHYFMYIIGVWYALGVVALLAPGFRVLKEWTYAGFTFAYTSAVVSHLSSGDGAGKASAPVVALLILATSYFLRPEGRRVAEAPHA